MAITFNYEEVFIFNFEQKQKLTKWHVMESCDHFWEEITPRHDFIHPPKCLNGCGRFMSPQERIDYGLSEIKTF